MHDDLLLLIISSPSGAGKTTLTKRLLEERDLMFSVSHTTRPPRTGEVDGQDYHFVDRETFDREVEAGHFAEWAEVHGNFYGTSLSELDRAREAGMLGIVFDVDYQGARQIKAHLPHAIGVFILPPSLADLEKRLENRGLDTPEVIARRFNKARLEIEHYLFFDYLIVNDVVEEAAARLRGIVHAESSRRERLAPTAENLLRTGHT
ncbi:MAG: guanylate kinase [Deltaproteobacteria bacterium]|nr:MAG: guanylate kinase [Deltaproteobacteria bacterium]